VLGATFFAVIARYAERLRRSGGRLYLSGVDPSLREQIVRVRGDTVSGPVAIIPVTPTLGESTGRALAEGRNWLVRALPDDDPEPE
jgi:SulP family sulfate permease